MKEIWEVRESGIKGNLAISVKGSPASAGRVATVPHYEGRKGRQRKIAHLISAAPDLLEALECLIELYQGPATQENMAIRAIEKARGEA